MGDGSTIVLGGLIVIVTWILYFGFVLAFLWAIWNWIVLPTMPYIAGLFA